MLDQHPHAAAVLGAALDGRPAHAYLLHGPAGSGKRDAARDFAAALLSRDAADPESARTRVQHGTHPDLTWVAPSGAHEMLRRDVEEAVVSAASRTPFEAGHRVFVLERADTMNDEAANALLKTLEEPPPYVVLLLLTDRLSQVLPTITLALPAGALRPAARRRARRSACSRRASRPRPPPPARGCRSATASAPLALALGDGPALRARAEAFARAPLAGRAHAERAWRPLLEQARAAGAVAREEVEAALAEELEYLPEKEHRRRETEFTERARRAERRATTGALDHALQLAGLWYRDCACVVAGAEELVHHADRIEPLREDAAGRDARRAAGQGRAGRRHPRPAGAERQRGAGARGARLPAREPMTEVHVHGAHATVRAPGLEDEVAVEEPLEIRVDGRAAGRHDAHARPRRRAGARVPVRRGADRRRRARSARRRTWPGTRSRSPARCCATRPRASFYTSSSCGVCGKGALEEVAVHSEPAAPGPTLPRARLAALPDGLRQPTFARTGGLHATGLFTPDGELACVREDVGRHNAMDKVVGWALREGLVPLHPHVLCVSGRLSFELVQKAAWRARRCWSASARRRRWPSGSPTTAA